ncbi:MAG: hypothetical protein HRT98_03260 [Mycoplasmatales bacterium]|nr:hypothetical protein [Mycoplasmatales bacterium]
MDILVKAGVKNKYWVHNRDYSKKCLETFGFKIYKEEYPYSISKMFKDLTIMILNISPMDHIDFEKEILLDLFLSLQHIASSLVMEDTLVNILQLNRLFLDNILRYYAFDKSREIKINPLSFDKNKAAKLMNKIKKQDIFTKALILEHHYSGAENHFASIFNRNIDEEYSKSRSQYIINSQKIILNDTKELMADIIVRVAKNTNKKNLAIFEMVILIYVKMGMQLIRLEEKLC